MAISYKPTKDETTFKAVRSSWRSLQNWRRTRKDLIATYLGNVAANNAQTTLWSGEHFKESREQVVALMQQVAEAYMVSLVAYRPRVMMSAANSSLQPFANIFRINFNRHIEDIRLDLALQDCVLNAFFTMGIMKTCYMDTGYVLEDGIPGWQPDCRSISLDYYVYDRTATSEREEHFRGDGYRVPFSYLEDERFDQTKVRKLTPTTKFPRTLADGQEPVARMLHDYEADPDEIVPEIDLFDLYCPLDGKVYTYALQGPMDVYGERQLLCTVDWEGSRFGPYRHLSFRMATDNLFVGGPAVNLKILHDGINSILRKQFRRAKNQKVLNVFTPHNREEADKARRAQDCEYISVKEGTPVNSWESPGPNPQLQAFALQMQNYFDRMGGNPVAKLGLGSQAPTATQEKLIHSENARAEAFLSNRTADFTHGVCRDLAELMWKDEALHIDSEYQIPGTPYRVEVPWDPEHREGDFADYRITIDPYSMQYRSPEKNVGDLMNVIGVYFKNPQLFASQGGRVDLHRFNDTLADLLNLPQLREIVRFDGPGGDGSYPDEKSGPGGQSDGETRVYARSPAPKPPQGDMESLMEMMQQQAPQNQGV